MVFGNGAACGLLQGYLHELAAKYLAHHIGHFLQHPLKHDLAPCPASWPALQALRACCAACGLHAKSCHKSAALRLGKVFGYELFH